MPVDRAFSCGIVSTGMLPKPAFCLLLLEHLNRVFVCLEAADGLAKFYARLCCQIFTLLLLYNIYICVLFVYACTV